MRKIIVILSILALALLSAMALVDYESVSACNPQGFTGGLGTWQIDGGECWYLHTVSEFDAPPATCIACHDGVQAGEW